MDDQPTEPDRNIDLYRVGVLAALHRDWRMVTVGRRRPTSLRQELRHLLRRARKGEWRAFRNSFNGWLAEHAYAGSRAGHGWTRRRALTDLRRHLAGGDRG